ncbi:MULTISPECIES: 30S ribosomal protein S16 [Nocardiopsis]|uniref:Small ribosomal subunit protein bS16 n=1 Tax=Nocardiopsis composta TaxID=157465 RepID=A0A7W8VFW4_9ACTN|nr:MULTISPECIES: 30S ribosomal protein S16 [Nocardiopsis]MBB5434981.1 small subunit ribosomal protein S16 [Nocardiopsis composta]
MAVKIKLKRMGKIRTPQYRIVVADARTKRDGKAIEEIGKYHPKEHPSFIEVKSDRAQYWLSQGAQPTDAVKTILKRTGDWQEFKGLPKPQKPLQVAEPRDKEAEEAAFQAVLKELVLPDNEGKGKAKKSEKKADKAAEKPAEAEEKPEGEA